MENTIKKYDWVDSLRGYAIFLVIMIHNTRGYISMNVSIHKIALLGDLGVQLFFILSSYTLFNSFEKRSKVDGNNAVIFFLIRRFFRIAPLYYLAGFFYIGISIIWPGTFVKAPLNFLYIITNYLFLNTIFIPAINYIPPGGWSIGIEMFFYLTIPILFKKIISTKRAIILLFSAIVISNFINFLCDYFINNYTNIDWVKLRHNHLYLWFPNQFPVFLFGILVYQFNKKNELKKNIYNVLIFGFLICFFGFAFFDFKISYPQYFFQREYFYALLFSIFTICVAKTNNRFIVNQWFIKLGKVSFSIYLIHFIVIEIIRFIILKTAIGISDTLRYLFSFPICLIISFLIASWTYKSIEEKGIMLGEEIISKLRFKHNLKND